MKSVPLIKKLLNGNRIASIVTAILAIWIYNQSTLIVTGFNEAVGPGEFPKLVAIFMFLLSVGLFFFPGDQQPWGNRGAFVRQAMLLILLALFAASVKPFGFIPTSIICAVLMIRLFGATWRQSLITGIGLGFGLYVLFEYLLGIPLPNIPNFII